MRRRAFLATAGVGTTAALSGCLFSDSAEWDDRLTTEYEPISQVRVNYDGTGAISGEIEVDCSGDPALDVLGVVETPVDPMDPFEVGWYIGGHRASVDGVHGLESRDSIGLVATNGSERDVLFLAGDRFTEVSA